MRSLVLIAPALLAACQPASTVALTADDAEAVAAFHTANDKPRFDPDKIAAAEADLRSWDSVLDLLHDPDAAVEWQIGVHNDGSRRIGYAASVCLALRQHGVADQETDVRIVDIAKLNSTGGDFRAASLGHIACADESDLGT